MLDVTWIERILSWIAGSKNKLICERMNFPPERCVDVMNNGIHLSANPNNCFFFDCSCRLKPQPVRSFVTEEEKGQVKRREGW